MLSLEKYIELKRSIYKTEVDLLLEQDVGTIDALESQLKVLKKLEADQGPRPDYIEYISSQMKFIAPDGYAIATTSLFDAIGFRLSYGVWKRVGGKFLLISKTAEFVVDKKDIACDIDRESLFYWARKFLHMKGTMPENSTCTIDDFCYTLLIKS